MRRAIVTTSWDDGHTLDIKVSDLLKKYGVKGTLYVSPMDREIKPEERLTNDEIAILAKDLEIGAHTMTHPRLTKVSDEVAKIEIVSSKKYLENIINKEVKSFCYPAGYYNNAHKEIVREAGFAYARSVDRYSNSIDDQYGAPTTIHAYRHISDITKIFNLVGIKKFIKSFLNWDELAIAIFDETLKNGGVFHLWGHSWEIEKNKDWDRLERVLKHISNREDVDYVTNSELIYAR